MTPYQNQVEWRELLNLGLIIVKYDTIPKLKIYYIYEVISLIIVKYDTIPKLVPGMTP